jgi:hypothetical protein
MGNSNGKPVVFTDEGLLLHLPHPFSTSLSASLLQPLPLSLCRLLLVEAMLLLHKPFAMSVKSS